MRLLILIAGAFLLVVLIVFLVLRNRKDQKELEEQLNKDYRKPKDEENDTEVEDQRSV
jgi:FtsZ-interacting cell division protein ZipA